MLMIASCYSDAELMKRTEELARRDDWNNVELMAAFLRKDTKACFDLLVRKKRYPEVEMRTGVKCRRRSSRVPMLRSCRTRRWNCGRRTCREEKVP